MVIISFWLVVQLLFSLLNIFHLVAATSVYWWVHVYNLKLALSLLHPGPFQLITLTSNVLMTYSQILVIPTLIIRNYLVIPRLRTVPTFFSIIYCNKTTYYSNFDYPKHLIYEVICRSWLKKWLLNYLSRFKVQMSRMVIMISLFGRVYFYYID